MRKVRLWREKYHNGYVIIKGKFLILDQLKLTIMKKLIEIIGLLLLIFLMSCSNGDTSTVIDVNAESTNVSGSLSKYIEVVDDNYEFENSFTSTIAIRIRAKEKFESKFLKSQRPMLYVSMLSEQGTPIAGIQRLEIDYESVSELQELLVSGEGESIIYLSSALSNPSKKQLKKLKLFTVSSSIETSETSSSDDFEDLDIIADSSGEYDEAIDELEAAVNDAIKMMKKYKDGNYGNAMTDYTNMLTRIQNASIKLQNLEEGDLTQEQIQRITKLQLKLATIQYN